MKRYKKKKRGSIFSLLISNYIAFTVAIVLTVMLITYLGMLLFTKQLKQGIDTMYMIEMLIESYQLMKVTIISY